MRGCPCNQKAKERYIQIEYLQIDSNPRVLSSLCYICSCSEIVTTHWKSFHQQIARFFNSSSSMMNSVKNFQQKQSLGSCHHVTDIDNTKTSLFFGLPHTVRHLIYKYSLMNSRTPPAKDVHEKLLSKVWKDEPSPLLLVNR